MKKRIADSLKALLTPGGFTGLYGLFLLTGFLLWVPETGYSSIVAPKHNLFMGSFGVFLGGLLLIVLCRLFFVKKTKGLSRHNGRDYKKVWIPLFLALGLAVWFFLSAIASPYQDTVWLGAGAQGGSGRHEGFFTLVSYLLIFAVCALFWKPGKLHRWAASVSAVLIFILAALQFCGLNPLELYPNDLTFHHRGLRYSGEYLGTIGNSGLLGSVLTVLCLYLLGSYVVSRGKDRFFLLAGGLCAWGGVLLSEVAAGPVAILGCLAVMLPVCIHKGLGLRRMGELAGGLCLLALGKTMLGYSFDGVRLVLFLQWTGLSWVLLALTLASVPVSFLLRRLESGKGFPKVARLLVAAYLLVALGAFLFLFFYNGGNEALQGLRLLVRGTPPDTLGSGRIAIWKDALRLGLERPLLGGGPDTYDLLTDFVFTRELPNGKLRRVSVDAAHNEYLQLWVCCGLPAMLLHLAMLGSVLLPAAKKGREEQLPLLLPVLGYSIYAFFGISQSLSAPLLYLMLGALAHSQMAQREKSRK